jgi:hypothetical protein
MSLIKKSNSTTTTPTTTNKPTYKELVQQVAALMTFNTDLQDENLQLQQENQELQSDSKETNAKLAKSADLVLQTFSLLEKSQTARAALEENMLSKQALMDKNINELAVLQKEHLRLQTFIENRYTEAEKDAHFQEIILKMTADNLWNTELEELLLTAKSIAFDE